MTESYPERRGFRYLSADVILHRHGRPRAERRHPSAGNKNAALRSWRRPSCRPSGNRPQCPPDSGRRHAPRDHGVAWGVRDVDRTQRGGHRRRQRRGPGPGSRTFRAHPRVDPPRGSAAGPFGSLSLPPPGGDVTGRRRLDTHLLAFRALGAEVETSAGLDIRASALKGAGMFLDEPPSRPPRTP